MYRERHFVIIDTIPMKKLSLLILIMWTSMLLAAQPSGNELKARELGKQAIQLMDKEQKYTQAIKLLKKAAKLDPATIAYYYEIAYAYYAQKDYEKVISTLKKVVKDDKADVRYYRLLGIAYDLQKEYKDAAKIFEKGIERFPYSGELYLEMGGLEYRMGRTDLAVNNWEQGIKRDPTFSSNYYWAAKMYLNSNEQIWGMFYGELFMNLERASTRTEEMSKLLFRTYKQGINYTSETTAKVSFSEKANMFLLLESLGPIDTLYTIPFLAAYELTHQVALKDILKDKQKRSQTSITAYTELRKMVNAKWFAHERDNTYPNILMSWHKQLIEADHFEAYTYWLLQDGDYAQFTKWVQRNEYTYKAFMKWFASHPLKLNEQQRFHRLQYYEGGE